MYLEIQKRINQIMVLLLIVTLSLLIGLYILFNRHIINLPVFACLCVLFIFMYHYIIRFLEQNLEHRRIYQMLKKNQFALATIKNVKFYKELRDSTFKKQFVYQFHIQIKTKTSKTIETDIYESLRDSQINCLPGDVYVTCDEQFQHVAIVPTLLLSMMPELEEQVREYEALYQTHYIIAVRNKGLSLRSVSDVIKDMKEKEKNNS